MAGRRDLDGLLSSLQPTRKPGRFVFTTVSSVPADASVVAMVREDEGTTLIVEQAEADRLGLAYDFLAAMITLAVESSLDAVGLTAAVSAALAAAGISCNIVAGYFHDHVFVPERRAADALTVLEDLAARRSSESP